MDRIVPAVLFLLVAAGLAYAGLRGIRGRAFWLPSANDGPPDAWPVESGIRVTQRYARPAGIAVLVVAVVLAAGAIRVLVSL